MTIKNKELSYNCGVLTNNIRNVQEVIWTAQEQIMTTMKSAEEVEDLEFKNRLKDLFDEFDEIRDKFDFYGDEMFAQELARDPKKEK